MNFSDSYFHLISNEILIEILKQITTYDLLQFCKAYNTDEYLNVNDLVRNINLSKCYNLRSLQPLRKVNFYYIKTININGLYWLKANQLRNFLSRLVKLDNLFAIDTVLDLGKKDLLIYHQLKLKKLAISVKQRKTCTKIQVPTVETLFIKLFKNVEIPVYHIFPEVKSLWFEEPESDWNFPLRTDFIEKSLHKTFGCIQASVPHEYGSQRDVQPYAVLFDSINLPEKIENVWPEEWQIVNQSPPYPFRTLYALKEKNIDHIMLDELNFNSRNECSIEYLEAIRKILSSPNTKYLKKLAIKICYLHYIVCCINEGEQEQEACCSLDRSSLQNLKYLEVLEIFDCSCSELPSDFFNKFPIIPQLKHLKYLLFRLYKHKIDNGQFLIDISNNCQQLETLKFLSTCENNKMFNVALCTALKNAKNLKDLQYMNLYSTSISDIFSAFCSIENPKLERLSLLCDKSEQWGFYEMQILERFLLKNPQLIFLYFRGLYETHKLIEPILMKYQKQHPAKHFVASNYSLRYFERTIPDIHYHDMVMDTSIVSNSDVYQEVESF